MGGAFSWIGIADEIAGNLLENTPELSFEGTDAVINKLVPPSKAALVELNAKALQMGKEYK